MLKQAKLSGGLKHRSRNSFYFHFEVCLPCFKKGCVISTEDCRIEDHAMGWSNLLSFKGGRGAPKARKEKDGTVFLM